MMHHKPMHTHYFLVHNKTKVTDLLTIFDMIARLTRVDDGHPIPSPQPITALGRTAIMMYLFYTATLWEGPVEAADDETV